jgi:hypothetical protein
MKHQHNPFKKKAASLGGQIVEAAIVTPIFFLMLFIFIEYSRYVVAKILLERGAQEALDLATKIEGFEASPAEAVTIKQAEYTSAREKILAAAVRLPSIFFKGIESNSETKLLPWVMNSADHPLNQTQSDVTNNKVAAGIIRVGERHKRLVAPNLSPEEIIDHPTAPYPNQRLDANPDFASALSDHQIIVELHASFQHLLPFLRTKLLRARAVGLRDIYISGKKHDPAPLPTAVYQNPTPVPTPAPTTPIPASTATPMPVPTTPVDCTGAPPCIGRGVRLNPVTCACVCKLGRVQIEPEPDTGLPPTVCVEAGE